MVAVPAVSRMSEMDRHLARARALGWDGLAARSLERLQAYLAARHTWPPGSYMRRQQVLAARRKIAYIRGFRAKAAEKAAIDGAV